MNTFLFTFEKKYKVKGKEHNFHITAEVYDVPDADFQVHPIKLEMLDEHGKWWDKSRWLSTWFFKEVSLDANYAYQAERDARMYRDR